MKVLVIGGGTAGLLSALMFQRRCPEDELTVVDSSKIGILGPGEGGTPALNYALEYLNIDIAEFMDRTESTYKNGLNLVGWNTDKPNYFHGFSPLKVDFGIHIESAELAQAVASDLDVDKINLSKKFSDERSVDIGNKDYAFHFDAQELANYLKEVALERGIKFIDKVVKSLNSSESGNISSVEFEDGSVEECDFLIDSTGFKRLVIGNHYKSEWKSVKDSLPCTTAIAFNLPAGDYASEPFTTAYAMDYGWSWRIPMKHRFGCGYVFDSNYINVEQATEEAKRKFGSDLKIHNMFEFEPGYYKKVWINNVLAVGISASFYEPLEATSINQSVLTLFSFLFDYYDVYKSDKAAEKLSDYLREEFNKYIVYANESFSGFLALHYVTNRNDTDFWINYKSSHVMPDMLAGFLEEMEESLTYKSILSAEKIFSTPNSPGVLQIAYASKRLLSRDNWLTIYAGNGQIKNYAKYLSEEGASDYEDTKSKVLSEFESREKLYL